MAFGKMGQGPQGQQALQARTRKFVGGQTLQIETEEAFEWRPYVLMFGAPLVAITALVGLVLVVLPGGKTQQMASGEPDPIVTSDVAPMDTVRQRMTTGEAGRTFEFAIKTQTSVRCFEHINDVRPWKHNGWTNRALDEGNRILKFEFEVAGEALNCLFSKEQDRFCEASERLKMSKAVAFYLKKHRHKQAMAKRAANTPETPRSKMYKDLAERMKEMDPGDDADSPENDAKRFFAGIERATSAGYFTAAEFGNAAELAPYIQAAEDKPCG